MKRKRKGPVRRKAGASPRNSLAELQRSAANDLDQGRIVSALEKLDQVICSGTADFETWSLAGNGLNSVHEYSQSGDAWIRALQLRPGGEAALIGLATAKYRLGQVSAAVGLFREAFAKHASLNALCNLAIILPGDPRSSPVDILNVRRQLADRLACEQGDAVPFSWRSPEKSAGRGARNSKRLRIGYISAYFHRANYMRPVWSLINHHRADQFEIHLIADFARKDQFDWLDPGSDANVHITTSLGNRELVNHVRELGLDLVIDLNGYSIPDRLPIYMSRLAPVVAAWFNMYGTSGMPGIDFLVGDPWVLKPDDDSLFSERLVRLPVSYLSFGNTFEGPPVSDSPFTQSGPDGEIPFSFGSLVSQYKITGHVLDAWCEILQGAPLSRLLLGNRALGSESNRDHLLDRFAARGIDSTRIGFLPPAQHFGFLQHYSQIDLALDAFPYNGGTTTTEALWQGVPVICFDGDRWAARTSKTLLANCGLEEFIAETRQDYVQLAIRNATDPGCRTRLVELRPKLRDLLKDSPVCDSKKFAVQFEQSIREMLQRK